jgi:glycosyltransferase involved in cell wall biosynthesis
MTTRTVDILVTSIHPGDATSTHTLALADLLRREHGSVVVHSGERPDRPPAGSGVVVRHTYPGDYIPQADLTILQYPIWFPLAERFGDAPGARIFWYHGVTPPELWGTDTERDILARSQMGTELAWHAHLAVAASPFTAAELHQLSGYPADRIRVVPLAIDMESFRRRPPQAQIESLRQRWGLRGKRVLLYTGRVAGNKRIDLLIRALAHLAADRSDLHVLIVGDTKRSAAYRDVARQLRALADELGVGHQVTLTGWVDAVKPYYHLADIYVLASQHEGFGAPLVEAMAAGVPIVASRSGAMPWVLGIESAPDASAPDEASGLTFEPGSAEHLAQQIERILQDPALRTTLVERGRRRCAEFGRELFEQRAKAVVQEAGDLARSELPLPSREAPLQLYRQADVALRNYRVRSGLPFLGRLIEWVRYNSTTHVKEAYLDRIVERQVLYNRLLADEVTRLHEELDQLRTELEKPAEQDRSE